MRFDILDLIPQPVFTLINQWRWLGRIVNRFAINAAVNKCRHRPHPWSTVHDFVSWRSLTDQSWSARHLPARILPNTASPDQITQLFARPSGEQRLCAKSTCLFPAFAQYLTDGFIRTYMPKSNEPFSLRKRNTSNHQIDLCPLYGRIREQTLQLRLLSEAAGQRGRMKSQQINGEEFSPFLFDDQDAPKAEFDALDLPLGLNNITDAQVRQKLFAVGGDRVNSAPHVAMMNSLFLREHNRVAGELDSRNPNWDDDRVFETARNIMIVIFIKIVVGDHINHINGYPFKLSADPSVAWNAPWNKPNWITAEFSLLYRWHSLIPDAVMWCKISYPVAATFFNNALLLQSGLAHAFADLSAQPAAQLGARNTARALLPIEISSIQQGRLYSLASYNDYRAYASLPRARRFEDVSANPDVVQLLRTLYETPDDVEFYPGLFAEDVGHNSPLPSLISTLVAVDAFSQALTNPLFSEHVFKPDTFTDYGWALINETQSLRVVLARNTVGLGDQYVSLTRADWQRR